MADVRELVTLLGFDYNPAGLKEYQQGVTKALSGIKGQLSGIGRLIGVDLAFNVGKEFISSLASDIRSASKLGTQIGQMLEPGSDTKAVMEEIFNFAQATGQAYADIGTRFKAMLPIAKEFNVSQETTMAAMQNITKSLEIQRSTDEEASAAFDTINMALRRGTLGARQFAEMLRSAPKVMQLLGESTGKTQAELRELATKGKLTSDVLLKAFGRGNQRLATEFAAKADTMGEAFTYVYNEIVRAGIAIWKGTGAFSKLASAIIATTKAVVNWGSAFIKAIGGADTALRLLTSAVAVFAGWQIASIIYKIVTSLWAMTAAEYAALAPWIAIGAAIAGAILLLEDIYVWMTGGESKMGDWFGPFEDFMKGINQLTAPFKALITTFSEAPAAIAREWASLPQQIEADLERIRKNNPFDVMKKSIQEAGPAIVKEFESLPQQLEDNIKTIQNPFDALLKSLREAGPAIKKEFTSLAEIDFSRFKIANPFTALKKSLDEAGPAISAEFENLTAGINKSIEDWKTYFINGFNSIGSSINNSVESWKTYFVNIGTSINSYIESWKTYFSNGFTNIGISINNIIEGWKIYFTNLYTYWYDLIIKPIIEAFNTVKTAGEEAWNYIKTAIDPIATAINTVVDAVKTVISWFEKLNELKFQALETAIDGINKVLRPVVKGIKAAVSWVTGSKDEEAPAPPTLTEPIKMERMKSKQEVITAPPAPVKVTDWDVPKATPVPMQMSDWDVPKPQAKSVTSTIVESIKPAAEPITQSPELAAADKALGIKPFDWDAWLAKPAEATSIVPPGAVIEVSSNPKQDNAFNISNNITVNATVDTMDEIAARVASLTADAMGNFTDRVAGDITRAMPRVEAATQ